MKRKVLGIVLLASMAAAIAPAARAAPDAEIAESQTCERLLKDANGLRAAQSFESFDVELRWRIYATLVDCGASLQRWGDVKAGLDGLTILAPDNADVRSKQIQLSVMPGQNPADGVETIEWLSVHSPETLSLIEVRLFSDLTRALVGDKHRLLRAYRAIFAANYSPPDTLDDLDFLKGRYAGLLIESGEEESATEQFKLISDPLLVAEFYFDRRYENFEPVRKTPVDVTLADLTRRMLENARQRAADHPGRLRAAHELAQALRLAGETAEAEKVSRDAVAKVRAAGAADAFSDFDESAAWILNEHAYVLYDLGRNEEARAVLAESATLKERGTPNVSQTINFASLLTQEGRFEEALTAIAALKANYASIYGEMWAASVRLCAAAFLDGDNDGDGDLAFIRANEKENDAAFARSMLCMNDADAYSAHLKRRLADPGRRTEALRALQRVRDPQAALPINLELSRRRDEVLRRDDVQAAINEVGKILDLPFNPIYWGSF